MAGLGPAASTPEKIRPARRVCGLWPPAPAQSQVLQSWSAAPAIFQSLRPGGPPAFLAAVHVLVRHSWPLPIATLGNREIRRSTDTEHMREVRELTSTVRLPLTSQRPCKSSPFKTLGQELPQHTQHWKSERTDCLAIECLFLHHRQGVLYNGCNIGRHRRALICHKRSLVVLE